MTASKSKRAWIRWIVLLTLGVAGAVLIATLAADRADKRAQAELTTATLAELETLSKRSDSLRDPLLFYWLGVRLSEANRPKDAVLALARSATLDARSPRTRYALGVALERVERPQEAEDQYKQAIALDAKAAQPHYALGKLYGRYQRWQDAVTYLKKATELDSADIEAPFLLAVTYEELGKRTHAPYREEARGILEKLEPRAPNDTRILKTLAGLYVFFNQIAPAEALYRRILKIDSDDDKTRARLGRSIAEQAETPEAFAEAETLLRECTRNDAANPSVPMALGVLHLRRNQPQQAIPYFQQAIQKGVSEPEAWFHLGRALAQSGRTQEAKEATATFERKDANRLRIRGLEMRLGFIEPQNEAERKQNIQTRLELAQILIEEKKYDVALAHLQIIQNYAPNHAEAQRLAQTCTAKLGATSAPTP